MLVVMVPSKVLLDITDMWIPLLFADICWRAGSCCGWWGTESCIWAVWRTCLCQNSCWQRVWLCPVYSQVAIASNLYVTFLCSGLGYFEHFCGSVICAINLGFCRASAEEALQRLHGTVIGSQSVRLSWGRSPTNKQTSQDVSLLSCFASPLLIWSLSAKIWQCMWSLPSQDCCATKIQGNC